MAIFIGYESALEFWRSPLAPAKPRLSHALPSANCRPDRKAVEAFDFASIGVTGKPVHLVIADETHRLKLASVSCHSMSITPPTRSFVAVPSHRGAYASSPNLLFLQKASVTPIAELGLLGLELCGSYTIDVTDSRGFRERDPLTSVTKLQRYVERAGGAYGSKQARRALRFIADNSASPMESIQAVLLFFPCSLGGHGVEKAELNGIVDSTVQGKPLPGGISYRCDMLWRSHRLAVEYESDLCHSDPEQIARDSKRRTDLIAAGYTVVTVTRKQLFDAREFEKVANLLIRRTGKKVRKQPYNVLTRRYELRRALFATIPKATGRA